MKEQSTNPHIPYKIGVIHGRFQILHNDHLKYLLAGKALCEHLVVGITNPDPSLTREDQADPNRSTSKANPLTYFERCILIKETLIASAIDCRDFTIVPFPINIPELYFYYVPRDAVFFVSIYDDWGRKKRDIFESLDLKTHVLWEVTPEEKGISGSDIRMAMLKNEPWEHLVPSTVTTFLKAWNISFRLQNS